MRDLVSSHTELGTNIKHCFCFSFLFIFFHQPPKNIETIIHVKKHFYDVFKFYYTDSYGRKIQVSLRTIVENEFSSHEILSPSCEVTN